MKKLTIKQERFAQEYVLLGNASEAYRRVYNASGMTDEAIHVSASRVKAKVTLRIQELQQQEAEKYSMTRAQVVKHWVQVLNADINELVQVRRKSCSYCFDGEIKNEPYPNCSKCLGEGHSYLYVADTRNLSEQGKLLYAGARKTREGIEIILRDKDLALTNIAKALGMFDKPEDKASQTLPDFSIDKFPTDPNEAAKLYQKIMMSN